MPPSLPPARPIHTYKPHTHTLARMRTHMHARTRTHMLARMHARMHARTHARTHTHTLSYRVPLGPHPGGGTCEISLCHVFVRDDVRTRALSCVCVRVDEFLPRFPCLSFLPAPVCCESTSSMKLRECCQ